MIQQLPKAMKERTITEMRRGESGYTVPWAMKEIQEGVFVDGSFSISKEPGGTVCMRVIRTKGGVRVDVRECHRGGGEDYKWHSGEEWPMEDMLPVESLITAMGEFT